MPERDWERLENLFTQACDLPDSARADFLARHCAGDPALLDELTALLRAHEAAAGFLDHLQIKAGAAGEAVKLAAGSRFGAWSVVRPIGRGGMGEVYEVSRADGAFAQRAALKLLRSEAANQIERFHAERSILARLDHPGIARLLDGGVADDGRPWAVLEYVEGQPITTWCAAHRVDLKQRLDLFQQVCDAVAYAHRNLIVHRDLKPSNILVDEHGRVRLLDFGIAKLIDPALGTSGETTQMPLTPDYCAPEQLAGEPVTTATDVYALGLLLYELLTGQKAWLIQGLPIAKAIGVLVEANAPKASVTAMTQANAPVPARLLRGDLDAIVARCLRKEPAHRYATVDALEQDAERYQQGKAVAARGGARTYVLGRFLRRYKWAVAGVMAIILALTAGIAATAWQAKRAAEQATRAEREARTANAVQEFMRDIFRANSSAQSDPVKARQTTARELLDIGAKKVGAEMTDAPEAKLGVVNLLGDLYKDLEISEGQILLRQQAVDLTKTLYGQDSPQLAAALTSLGDALYKSSDPKRSEPVLNEAQAILDGRHDENSEIRGRLLLKQAQFYRLTDRPRSLTYAQRAKNLFAAMPPSMDLVEALQLQAKIQLINGNQEEAIASMSQAIDVLQALSEGRASLIDAYGELASYQIQSLDYSSAEGSVRLALDLSLAIYGEQHIQTVRKTVTLGRILFLTGRTHEGLDLLTQAKQKFLALGNSDNPTDVAYVLGTRGSLLLAAGDLDASEADLQTVLATLQRGQKSITLATVLDTLASTWMEMGRYDAARTALDEAAEILTAAGQKPGTVAFNPTTEKRMELAMDQGRFVEAQHMLEGYVVPDLPERQLTRYQIVRWLSTAELRVRAGDFKQAFEPLAHVRAAIAASGQSELYKIPSSRADYFDGMAKLGNGDAAAALPLIEHSLAHLEKTQLSISPTIAGVQIDLAECHLALGHVAQARELAAKAQAIHAQHKELGEHYREPLRRLLQHLATASRARNAA